MMKPFAALAAAVVVLAGCGTSRASLPSGAFLHPGDRASPAVPRTALRAPAPPAGAAAALPALVAAAAAAPRVSRLAPTGPTNMPVTLPDGSRYMAYAAAATPDDGAEVAIVTFNTAIGNSKIKTPQHLFPTLPFYAAAIAGALDAPIMCLQEVGNAQRAEVEKLGKGNAAFTWRYQRVGVKQGNMLVIPRRYVLEKYDDPHFGWVQAKAAGKLVWDWIGPGGKPQIGQLIEPRGFQVAWLRDTVTGRRFVLVNTHVSYMAGVQQAQARKLFEHAFKAAGDGPLVVAGDLNARTADTDEVGPGGKDADVRGMFRDLADMGPVGRPPHKTNIDWILARGFAPVRSRWYTGTSISLPGSPDALTVSDHYAEEDVLRFEP